MRHHNEPIHINATHIMSDLIMQFITTLYNVRAKCEYLQLLELLRIERL